MFQGWGGFYQILGPAAATLMGLLFVVITLTRNRSRSTVLRAAGIYFTPTGLHFATVLSLSAVIVAPRLTRAEIAGMVGAATLAGLAASARACLRMARPRPDSEPPHRSDIWFYGVAPPALYLSLAAMGWEVWAGAGWAARGLAVVLLALLLLGMRNAWDLVTWMAPRADGEPGDDG